MKEIQRRLKIFLTLFFLVTVVGTIGFMMLENLSFAEAFYYNIVTMSTVGYGDIHPTSSFSRLFAVFLIIMGGSTFLGVIANATEILIVKRETQNRMKKVNMVLGVFFSEVGYRSIDLFLRQDKNVDQVRPNLLVDLKWKAAEFTSGREAIKAHSSDLKMDPDLLTLFHEFIMSKRQFLVSLVENPVLIENDGFSEALLALFHLMDELESRGNFQDLPDSDIKHLSGDFNRAYQRLVVQWLVYLEHLKGQYPYLFSLAIRKNPFNPNAGPVIYD